MRKMLSAARLLRPRRLYMGLCETQHRASYGTETAGAVLINEAAAKSLFQAFHVRNNPYYMGPGRFVLYGEDYSLSRVRVPFWVFSGAFRYQYKLQGDANSDWSAVPVKRIELGEQDEAMQVCATFKYRHDFVNMLKGEHVPHVKDLMSEKRSSLGGLANESLADEVGDGDALGLFEKETVEVTRGLAWDFVVRNVERKMQRQISGQHGGDTDVRMRISGTPHGSQMVYLPAYVIHYTFGEKVDVHNERSKDRFYAMVSAIGGRVASEVHVSTRKAAVMGGGLAMSSMGLASIFGYDSALGWSGFDYGFIGAGSAALGALLAQVLRPGAQNSPGPFESCKPASDEWDALLDLYNSEWARWSSGSVGFEVVPEKRRRWAESILCGHRSRQKRLYAALEERAESEIRDREREQRWERRSRRWGPVESRVGLGATTKRDHDYLGYYAALGFVSTEDLAQISRHDIKKAFLRKVRTLHPDSDRRQKAAEVTDGSERSQRASESWLLVVEAYDVLRDPGRRKKYDNGEATRGSV